MAAEAEVGEVAMVGAAPAMNVAVDSTVLTCASHDGTTPAGLTMTSARLPGNLVAGMARSAFVANQITNAVTATGACAVQTLMIGVVAILPVSSVRTLAPQGIQ
jgi:hypothetical protein